MAKIKIIHVYLLLLLVGGNSCFHQANVAPLTDTPPEETYYRPVEVIPLPETASTFDTVQVKTETVRTPDPKKKDTVKTTVVVMQAPVSAQSKRIAAQKIYTGFIGIREATGNNDGPVIKMVLASVGLPEGNPYCAAGVHYTLAKAGVPNSITGWSPTALNRKKPVWLNRVMHAKPQIADVGVLYYPNLGRIGHAFFWDKAVNPDVFESVEFNTNAQNSREGNGIWRRIRSYRATYGISDFIL